MTAVEDPATRTSVVREAEREGVWFLGNYLQMFATGDDTEGRYTFFEVHAPSGGQPGLHAHREADEAFVMLEGEIEVWAGPMHTTLRAGDYAMLPKQVPHTFLVTSKEPARFLVLIAPAGFEKFIRAIGSPAEEPRIPDPGVRPTLEEIAAAAAGTDLEQLGPPGTLP